jgi:very-short-patch-repair endonuclease
MKLIKSTFGNIRIAKINDTEYGSVYDALVFLGLNKSARKMFWSRLKNNHPEMLNMKYFKFEGRGQRDTPVMTHDDLVRLGNIATRFIDLDNDTRVKFIRKEFVFGEDIVKNLFSDYAIIPQYPVLNGEHFLDWYVPELNIAIEFDEEHHKYQTNEDRIRQKRIEGELGCRFIRYTDYK